MRGAPRTLDTRSSPRCPCKYCSQQHPHLDGRRSAPHVQAEADAEVGVNAAAPAAASGSVRSAHIKNLKSRAEKKQSIISRGLRRVRARVLAQIKDGEQGVGDGDGNGDDEEDVDELMEDAEERGGAGEGGEHTQVDNGAGAVDAEVVKVDVDAEPTNVNAEPINVDVEPTNVNAEPTDVDAEPINVDVEPTNVDAEPTDVVPATDRGVTD